MSAPEGVWRLALDASRCDAHGICALRCPDRIGLDQWGYAAVDPAPLLGGRALRRARAAAAACPEHALDVVPASGVETGRGRGGGRSGR